MRVSRWIIEIARLIIPEVYPSTNPSTKMTHSVDDFVDMTAYPQIHPQKLINLWMLLWMG